MRALVMQAAAADQGQTEVAERPVPSPGPGEVSIDVAYAGVNFADVMGRRGDAGYVAQWPFTPGLEVAGTVRELGEGVDGLHPGQRVAALTSSGGLAEIAVASAGLVVAVDGHVSLRDAAAAPIVATTAVMLLDGVGHLAPGERVLMHAAAGGVGAAVAALAPSLDAAQTIGTVSSEAKVEHARALGWDTVLVRGDGLAEDVREATGGAGVDLILDAAGTTLLEVDAEIAAPGARIVLFGNAGGTAPGPLLTFPQLLGGNLTLSGFSVSRLSRTQPARVAAALRRALSFIADGTLALGVVEVPLSGVGAVHDAMAAGTATGKAVAALTG